MKPAVIALFREVADRSAEERAGYYARHGVPEALSAEVESLLRFDSETVGALHARVAAGAADVLLDRDHADELRQPAVAGAAQAPDPAGMPIAPTLANGLIFGPYRIVRPLGRGGMAVVYEADEIESGRRVALKVLARVAHNTRERERFEREGRLAASLNHPHCVFVFGASEIDGHPFIAMEVMQGTLADRLKREGPLPPAAAVDAMLHVITGLRAAEAAGILHRDIKPSNCFVDAQGVVKIGDFGISRSQRPTEETALSTHGQIPATPAYASPEQLRGAGLDVRADIYSLGATLYELLTGKRPFDAPEVMALLMAVANDTPTAPHVIASAVPRSLSAVVLHCLAKQPEQRFADYDALAAALEPYSSTAPGRATLGRRCLAGLIDSIPLILASFPLSVWWGGERLTIPLLLCVGLVEILYFGISESLWAATPGKALCGLMVVQQGGTPARWWQVIGRATTYAMFPAIPVLALIFVGGAIAQSQSMVVGVGRVKLPPEPVARVLATPESLQIVTSAVNALMLLILFSTARRRNGYAGLHDLLSRTRVVERRLRVGRRASAPEPAEAAPREVVARLGPFVVVSGTIQGMPDGWRPGFDERLRRPVWIREVPPGTPSISVARCAINRATRLRWLAGRRNEREAWDAFEAVQGVPLDAAVSAPRLWGDVRGWLLDVARECAAQTQEDQPPRRRDRVWVLDRGGAKLVDDAAVDATDAASHTNVPAAEFLLDIVRAVRNPAPERGPWPFGAHEFLEQLTAQPDMHAPSIVATLEQLNRHRPAVTVGWRALALGVPLLFPLFWGVTILMGIFVGSALIEQEAQLPADVRIAAGLLRALDDDARGVTRLAPRDREAVELALQTRYGAGLTDARLFAGGIKLSPLTSRHRRLANELLRRPPANGARPDTPASAAIDRIVKRETAPPHPLHASAVVLISSIALTIALVLVAAVALMNALMFRGGIMRLLGLDLVTADGRLASRRRVFVRTLVAWAPVLLVAAVAIWSIVFGEVRAGLPPELGRGSDRNVELSSMRDASRSAVSAVRRSGLVGLLLWLTPLCMLVMTAGAIVAIVNPARGIHDRLAGTWIVPR